MNKLYLVWEDTESHDKLKIKYKLKDYLCLDK